MGERVGGELYGINSGEGSEAAGGDEDNADGERFLYCRTGAGLQWVFNSELTPESGVAWARPKGAAAAEDAGGVPTGQGMEWKVFDGAADVDLALTVEAA